MCRQSVHLSFQECSAAGSNLLIGDLIEMQFLGNSYNPNLGAAISLVLMVIILLIMTILNQFDDDEDKVLM